MFLIQFPFSIQQINDNTVEVSTGKSGPELPRITIGKGWPITDHEADEIGEKAFKMIFAELIAKSVKIVEAA